MTDTFPVGRAGFIRDNLIAAGKAKPMVVVMPPGHPGPFSFGGRGSIFGEFEAEYVADSMPQMEQRYRVHSDRANRAMAGLSMGGARTLNIGLTSLAALVDASTAIAADVTGAWKGEFETQIGVQEHTFTLKQDGERITGKANSEISGEKREVELKDGKLNAADEHSFWRELKFLGDGRNPTSATGCFELTSAGEGNRTLVFGGAKANGG